ncbi:hypothetical protein ACTJK3_18460 [Pseudomonas sp. 22105]|uniref:hypothetical protein n=1 Tax=Pseudomonas TaxID=286 RepID=UPI00167C85D2|nr:hypothetical protein [Pseudomonas glycinae]
MALVERRLPSGQHFASYATLDPFVQGCQKKRRTVILAVAVCATATAITWHSSSVQAKKPSNSVARITVEAPPIRDHGAPGSGGEAVIRWYPSQNA